MEHLFGFLFETKYLPAKIAFIISPLHGQATQWAMVVWEHNHQVCSSYQVFSAKMRRIFDHSVWGREVASCLLPLGSQPLP